MDALVVGYDLNHVAAKLGMHPSTASTYIHRACVKLGALTTFQAIGLWVALGLHDQDAATD